MAKTKVQLQQELDQLKAQIKEAERHSQVVVGPGWVSIPIEQWRKLIEKTD